MLQNLFDNAVKYSPPGGAVTVEVFTAESFEEASAPRKPDEPRLALLTPDRIDAGFVAIRVIDQGPGVDDSTKERLFEPFFSTKSDGMGMGLNICRSIIESHLGRLWVENNADGIGCTFKIILPLNPL